ncbi:MAG: hypothetical protein ACT4OF_13830 [Caulobacteraceae bacterium]
MSLNKTLDRLFDEIRREAKRNPDFADRLDAVLRLHESRRDVSEEVVQEMVRDEASVSSPARGGAKKRAASAPTLNPAGLYKKEGEGALTKALASHDLSALRALVAEHNLDPSGVTPSLTRDELAAHIVSQAKRRAERDEKMFDY